MAEMRIVPIRIYYADSRYAIGPTPVLVRARIKHDDLGWLLSVTVLVKTTTGSQGVRLLSKGVRDLEHGKELAFPWLPFPHWVEADGSQRVDQYRSEEDF